MSAPAPEQPSLVAPVARPAAAGRVAVGLVLFGVIDFVQSIATIIAAFKFSISEGGHINLSPPFGCLAFWFAAWLVWKDKRIIWPILAYLAALGLGLLAGVGLMGGFRVPVKLMQALVATHPGWFGLYLGYLALLTIFLAWLLVEAGRVDWPPALTLPRRRWLRPRAFVAYAAVLGALGTAAGLALLTGAWTEPVLARARQKLGQGYDYQLLRYHVRMVNGHTTHRAVVLAYTETELDQIALNWEDD